MIQKILDIETSIKYLLYRVEDTEETTVNAKASATTSKLSLLRQSFQEEKNKREREALEDLASDLPGLDCMKKFWESEEITKCFLSTMDGFFHTPKKAIIIWPWPSLLGGSSIAEMLNVPSHLCMAHSQFHIVYCASQKSTATRCHH